MSAAPRVAAPLRICADPNNLPFSNRDREGFENQIAELVARDLRRPLAYFWSPQRRGFIRNTLDAGRCDLVIGVPAQFKPLQSTRPYYRSSYAFVTRRDRHLRVRSFDDPRLKTLTIGIQITGDDYNNPPAAQALASRHIIQNVRGFTVYGDYSQPDPQRDLVDAVADRRVDVGVMWGPLAGFFARRAADRARRRAGQHRARRSGAGVRLRYRDGCPARRSGAARRAGRDHRSTACGDSPDPDLVRSAAPMTRAAGRRWALALAASLSAAACGRTPPSGGSTAAPPPIVTAVGPVPGPSGDLAGAARDERGGTNPYAGDRTATTEGRQLFVRFNCSGCHGGRAGGGMGPSLRDVDWLYGDRDAQLFSSIAEGRAHGMPSWQPRITADQIWKLVTYIKSLRTRNEPNPPQPIEDRTCCDRAPPQPSSSLLLSRRSRAVRLPRTKSPAETQPGAAADLNRPPHAGDARAGCADLPSAGDLKKWLRAAPGVDGEAGGLFSGQMEWASIVNRQGELCATAVATDDPASAWPGSQAISKAKAYTANAYSTDGMPLVDRAALHPHAAGPLALGRRRTEPVPRRLSRVAEAT